MTPTSWVRITSPPRTPYIFLLGSGIIMTLALFFSKSAQNVIKTSVNLSRQDDGEETFGSSRIARGLVRTSSAISTFLERAVPQKARTWIDSRFNKQELTMEPGAAFDLVRASVNLVLAGLLIALGTSFKLPLSTTYVTFMVGMGTSLADRAWGRESAVRSCDGCDVGHRWLVHHGGCRLHHRDHHRYDHALWWLHRYDRPHRCGTLPALQ